MLAMNKEQIIALLRDLYSAYRDRTANDGLFTVSERSGMPLKLRQRKTLKPAKAA